MEALGRAVAATRAGQPARAARIVGAALAGQAAEPRRPVAGPWLDPEAEVVEPAARRRLGEVLRALRQGRRVAPAPEVPDGAAFLERRYACAAGARDYRLYVPASGRRGRLRGLVVMLHGCRQNPEDFATGTGMNALAEARRLLVAYPGQTAVHNAHGCWNWFRPRDQRRGAGEPAIIAGMARALAAEFGIDRREIFVAGLSAGGAMAAVLGAAYPDVFAAIGVHSGLPAGAANDAVTALAAMRGEAAAPAPDASGPGPRTIVFHGTDDATVRPLNAERIVAGFAGGREARGVAGGRRYRRRVFRGGRGELWTIEGAGHAWSGGKPPGSYTDPHGPDASAEMVRFFLR